MRFEWNKAKEAENVRRHGVDFIKAQEAFRDPGRLVAVDEAHSETEQRLFCIGRAVDGGILTVRYTRRGDRIGLLARATGAKAGNYMKKRRIRYTDDKGEIVGELRRVKDDLPSPNELTRAGNTRTKVTLALDDEALAFFRREAAKRGTSYQRMIRNLVRFYAQLHSRT